MKWGSLTWLLQIGAGAQLGATVHHGFGGGGGWLLLVRKSSSPGDADTSGFYHPSGLAVTCVVKTGHRTPCLAAEGRESVGQAVPLF